MLTEFSIGDVEGVMLRAIDLGRQPQGNHAIGVRVSDLREFVDTMARVDPNGTWDELEFLVTDEGLIIRDADDRDGDWAIHCPVMSAEDVAPLVGDHAMRQGSPDSPWVRLSEWEFYPVESGE